MITTPAGGGREYKWLAESYAWSKDGKTLTINIRKGVKWTDGKPLTAADVVYSMTAGKQDPTMDILGTTREGTNIASVQQKGTYTVLIKLKSRDSEFVSVNLNGIFVVPKHVFSKVADINKFLNPNPVGSGPFVRVSQFSTQSFVLEKNPSYWRKGEPKIPCLQYIQATSNDAALLQIVSGQADWTHNFVPNVEKAYIAKDPNHYHAFYATTAYPISLMFDTQKYPYSIVAFRKAVSRAIDRNKVSKLGEYGYAPPTDAIGLHGLFPSWLDKTVAAKAKLLANYNPAAAKKLLTDAGFTYKGSDLYDPKGDRVKFDIHVISGWSDWVASLQIITKNLKDIGIDANVKLEPDWGSWYPNATSTKTVTLLWQTAATGSPFGFFFNNMHKNTYVPSGRGRRQHGELRPLPERAGDVAARPVEGDARQDEAEAADDEALEPVARPAADRAVVHRPAVVDVLDEVLPLLPEAEGLLHASDLQHLPRQRRCADAHLPGRTSRAEQPDPVVPLQEPVGGPATPAHRRQSGLDTRCAISFDVSGSTRSLSGARSR